MRYDGEQKARSHERILKEAAAAIRVHGIKGVSVASIMERAGLTHGGFYAHFKSKDDLIAAAIQHMFDERYEKFLSRVDLPDPRSTLSGFIDRYLSMQHRDLSEKGCPIPALSSELPRLPESAREHFRFGLARLTDGIRVLLEHMGSDNASSQAHSTMAEMVGALVLARAHPDRDQARGMLDASRDALKRRLGLTQPG